jgi:hypothetical protein
MSSLKQTKINISVDLAAFSSAINIGEITPPQQMGEYQHNRNYLLEELNKKKKNQNTYKPCHYFKMIAEYFHSKTGNRATICYKRKNFKEKDLIPSFKVTFESSYTNPLDYTDVEKAVKDLKCLGADLRVSVIHLAIDFVNQQPIKLHEKICRRIKPGKKSTFKEFDTTHYYGYPSSACTLAVYRKTKQLHEKKKIIIPEDICRVEIRMRIPRLKNFVSSLEDVGRFNWLWFYNRHFSFHYPNHKTLGRIGKKQATKKTIWELRDFMVKKIGITPSNFYRDYLRDHSVLATLTIKALDKFRWHSK